MASAVCVIVSDEPQKESLMDMDDLPAVDLEPEVIARAQRAQAALEELREALELLAEFQRERLAA
jgi:hypothetical protein